MQGLTGAQVKAHGARAFGLYEAHKPPPRRQTGNRSTVRRSDWPQDAACLALLATPVALWAWHMLAGVAE